MGSKFSALIIRSFFTISYKICLNYRCTKLPPTVPSCSFLKNFATSNLPSKYKYKIFLYCDLRSLVITNGGLKKINTWNGEIISKKLKITASLKTSLGALRSGFAYHAQRDYASVWP